MGGALGQIMLYVDGMNGVINHNETIQWLYTLIGSKALPIPAVTATHTLAGLPLLAGTSAVLSFRLVVKTALKLLLVFVEYSESNAPLLIQAISAVDTKRGVKPWSNIMEILEEKDGVDTELLVYAMTLVNKTLSGLPDQDTFYDVVDCLEELGIAAVSQRHLSKKGTDLDLVEQLNIYEVALRHEDEDSDETAEPPPSGRRDRRRASRSWDGTGESVEDVVASCQWLAFRSEANTDLLDLRRVEEEEEEEQPITEPNSEEEREDDALCQGEDSEASPASEQIPTGKDAAPRSPGLPAAAGALCAFLFSWPGLRVEEEEEEEQPITEPNSEEEREDDALCQGEDRLTVTRKTFISAWKMPQKASPTIEKLPYVPHSPFHLFSYDFEDSPLSAKEKEAECQQESRYSNFGNNSHHSSRPSSGSSVPTTPTSSLSPQHETRLERHAECSPHTDAEPDLWLQAHLRCPGGKSGVPVMCLVMYHGDPIGLWSTGVQDAGVNEQCGDILTSKRFMLDMLYAHNRKPTDDEEKGEGETRRPEQGAEAVASLASRISTLQANSFVQDESVRKVDVDCLDNRGSVKAFAEKFNSGDLGKGSISPDGEPNDKVTEKASVQPKTESDYIWDQLMANPRELRIQDMDFTDLGEEDDIDVLDVDLGHREAPGPPPPPPPTFLVFNAPQGLGWPQVPRGQPAFTKKKKTIRLFWNEVRPFEWPCKNNGRCREFLWSKLEPIKVDTSKLEHLFESKSKELAVSK
ncbi:hypothetical protein CB1_000669017, partial [Camelus ferus]